MASHRFCILKVTYLDLDVRSPFVVIPEYGTLQRYYLIGECNTIQRKNNGPRWLHLILLIA